MGLENFAKKLLKKNLEILGKILRTLLIVFASYRLKFEIERVKKLKTRPNFLDV